MLINFHFKKYFMWSFLTIKKIFESLVGVPIIVKWVSKLPSSIMLCNTQTRAVFLPFTTLWRALNVFCISLKYSTFEFKRSSKLLKAFQRTHTMRYDVLTTSTFTIIISVYHKMFNPKLWTQLIFLIKMLVHAWHAMQIINLNFPATPKLFDNSCNTYYN